jgi:tetratricopeptide (TPR) repeat protein
VLPGIWQLASNQSNPEQSINLTHIETSIQQGKIALVEKPLFDYAIAHPKDIRALELLGQVRYQQNRLDEALALYQRVLALDPSLVKARINLGQLMYEMGQHESARLLLGEIAATSTVKVNERLALAKALVMVGEFQKALAVADKLPLVLKSNAALPVRAAGYLGLGDRQSLIALVPSIRKAAISDAEIAIECAEVFRNAGMSQEAVGVLRLPLARSPNNFRLLVLLGQMETQVGNLAEARRYLDRAAKLKPNTADSLYSVGMLESAEGNYEVALSHLKQAHALAPQAIPILTQLIINAMQANRAQMAVDFANELLQLKPDDPESLYLFGAASLQAGSLSAAQSALERFAKKRPEDQRGCLALGIAFAGQPGRQQQAKSQFEQCVKLDPGNVEPKYQLGLIFKSEGEVQKAIQMFEEVITRAANHSNALRDLGALYIQTGAEAKARAVLERAAALKPEDAETHFQLSRLYNLIGESKLARQHLGLFQKLKGQREKLSQP